MKIKDNRVNNRVNNRVLRILIKNYNIKMYISKAIQFYLKNF